MKFYTPRKVHFGWRSVSEVSIPPERIAIVTGKHVWSAVKDFMDFDGEVHIIKRNSPTGEPEMGDVDSLATFLREVEPESIFAVGGGSVIDSAKLAWIFYEHPHISWNDVFARRIPPLRNRAKFYAIETTSGTGTGISAAAVVTDPNGLKHGVVSEELIPDVAIYDPNFVMSMPKKTVIFSGMDALSHAIEAYVSKIDNLPADTLALKAIEVIFENILHSVDGIEESRAMMHYANMMAAMGFANSRLGLVHAVSHKIGGRLHVEHGKINAIMLPHFIRATRKYTRRFEDIERILKVEDLAIAIEELNEQMGIPNTCPDVANLIPTIVDEILADPLMKTNPGDMGREDVIAFLKSVAGES